MGHFYSNQFRETRSIDNLRVSSRKVAQAFETACHYLNSLVDAQTEANSGCRHGEQLISDEDIVKTFRQQITLSGISPSSTDTYDRILTTPFRDQSPPTDATRRSIPKPNISPSSQGSAFTPCPPHAQLTGTRRATRPRKSEIGTDVVQLYPKPSLRRTLNKATSALNNLGNLGAPAPNMQHQHTSNQ